jgi:hypothetical protein
MLLWSVNLVGDCKYGNSGNQRRLAVEQWMLDKAKWFCIVANRYKYINEVR